MFKLLTFEISGSCNAKCPWCHTGALARASQTKRFLEPERFARVLDHLLKLGAIGPDSLICLYNWGEPTLHPQFNEILAILNRRDLHFLLSSNGSLPIQPEPGSMVNLEQFLISMPGFSQASYDKIHGFQFEKILKNIDDAIVKLAMAGFKRRVQIRFHTYQFNIHELKQASAYFAGRPVIFEPTMAYIANFNQALAYLKNELDNPTLTRLSKDLLLFYVDGLVASTPADYHCPEFDYLTLDEECNLLTCCVLPRGHEDYTFGSVFDLTLEEINARKLAQKVCRDCLQTGLAHWVHSSVPLQL
ncbi:MAG: radical SAM protein [Magnetococcales bacterium]|nr:radical SAM protein [Magnetococcales bacterium]